MKVQKNGKHSINDSDEVEHYEYTVTVPENENYIFELGDVLITESISKADAEYFVVTDSNGNVVNSEGNRADNIFLKLKQGETYKIQSGRKINKAQVFNLSDYGDFDSVQEYLDSTHESKVGVVEKTFSMYFLSIGDYAEDFLRDIFQKEEVSIDRIVYNKVAMLNANFFDKSLNAATSDPSTKTKKYINEMYNYFKKLTIVVILIGIVSAGVGILLKTAQAKVKAMDTLKKTVMAIALIFLFPYVMRFAFDINEAIVTYIANRGSADNELTVMPITPSSMDDDQNLEFRSPEYVSLEKGILVQSPEAITAIYKRKIQNSLKNLDVTRLMRLYAGVTYRFAFIIIWYILLAQTYILAFIYIKRFFTIAFLIIIYPWVVIRYVIDSMSAKRKGAFNSWCQRFFSTIFLQTMHAVMYGIISEVILYQLFRNVKEIDRLKVNVILMIVATSFLFSGEKLLKTFWKNSIDSSDARKGLKEAFGAPKRIIGAFRAGKK